MENSGGSGGTLLHSLSFTKTASSSSAEYSSVGSTTITNIDASKFYNAKLYSMIVIEFIATSASLSRNNTSDSCYFEIRLGSDNNSTSIHLTNTNDKASVVTSLSDNGSRSNIGYKYKISTTNDAFTIAIGSSSRITGMYSCFYNCNKNSSITLTYSFKGYYPVTVP